MMELYQAEWCPHSHRVRERFTELGVSFVARPVPAEPGDREEMRRKTGSDEIPALVLDDGSALTDGADAIIAHLETAFSDRADAGEHRRREQGGAGTPPPPADYADAWIAGEDGARWRSAPGHSSGDGARASGSSLVEVPAGCRLPVHTDSAEETIVVTAGAAEVLVGGERTEVVAGGVALVPRDVPHEVRNAGDGPLRFAAVYAAPDVVTTYAQPVQPDGGRQRQSAG